MKQIGLDIICFTRDLERTVKEPPLETRVGAAIVVFFCFFVGFINAH
jgi:hypothetical protein